MIPPEINAPDLRQRQNEISVNLADAMRQTRVRRVVFLSSVNAQYPLGTGPISDYARCGMKNRIEMC